MALDDVVRMQFQRQLDELVLGIRDVIFLPGFCREFRCHERPVSWFRGVICERSDGGRFKIDRHSRRIWFER